MRPKHLLLLGLGALMLAGCRQDMHDQPKLKPQRGTDFFGDRRSNRPLVANTVARGFLRDDKAFFTGKVDGKDVDKIPFPVTKEVLARGQERFNIYCTPCHGPLGNGTGMIVRRGFKKPTSYHIDRLRDAADGYIYDVITNGYGAMNDYAAQVEPRDRWAIVAYIRALQLSQHAALADVPADKVAELSAPPAPAAEKKGGH